MSFIYRWEKCTKCHFNKVASDAYKEISDEYKQHLKESSGSRIQPMSRKSIMKCGEKAFKKIQKEVRYASSIIGVTFVCIFTLNLNFIGSKSILYNSIIILCSLS